MPIKFLDIKLLEQAKKNLNAKGLGENETNLLVEYKALGGVFLVKSFLVEEPPKKVRKTKKLGKKRK